MRVAVEAEGGLARDEVRLQYGVRRLDWDGAGARINLQPLYMHGIARHEDAVTRGKVRAIFRAVSNTYSTAHAGSGPGDPGAGPPAAGLAGGQRLAQHSLC